MKNNVDRNNWYSILVALLVFVLEIAIFGAYFIGFIPFIFFAILHCCVLAGLVAFFYDAYKHESDLRYPLLLLLSIFGVGPFGALGFLLFAIAYPLFRIFSSTPEEWFEGLFPEVKQSSFSNIYQRVTSGWDDYAHMNEVATFEDLFFCGTLSQKQAVLDAVVQDFIPQYSPILRAALKDPHNSVRIQAAAIMSKIDIDFSSELAILLAQNKKTPNDPVLTLKLAQHYDTYAFLGILEPVRVREVGENAILCYHDYLRLKPDDRRVWFSIGRLLFQMKEYEEFLTWYAEFHKKQVVLPTIVQTWYFHALYKLRRFEDLAQSMTGPQIR